MIVVGIVVAWSVVVILLCAALRHATRVPWWEAMLLDLDSLDVTGEHPRTSALNDRVI